MNLSLLDVLIVYYGPIKNALCPVHIERVCHVARKLNTFAYLEDIVACNLIGKYITTDKILLFYC